MLFKADTGSRPVRFKSLVMWIAQWATQIFVTYFQGQRDCESLSVNSK